MRIEDLVYFCAPARLIVGAGTRAQLPALSFLRIVKIRAAHALHVLERQTEIITDKLLGGGGEHTLKLF